LRGKREIETSSLLKMAAAIEHRGPDELGYVTERGLGLANRRLSIVGLSDGQQPIYNEDHSVVVVYNGELFDYIEQRKALEERGHLFRTSCDTEVLVHLWEEYGEGMLTHLHGQFGFALYDFDKRTLILARDRLGICPLHWARRGDWLYFGSEIKAILASGRITPEVDHKGIDQIFTFFAMPGTRTAFKGISAIGPGHYLKVQFTSDDSIADISERQYWDFEFPDAGDEYDPADSTRLVDEFRDIFRRAVEVRLRADVPVVSYLSGGVDSATVAAFANQIRGEAVPTFTIKIDSPGFDETEKALMNARTIGSQPTVVRVDPALVAETYPKLISAADCPVVDTACAALYCLAQEVHRQGFKVALTGEGADEALAGYPWFKANKAMRLFDYGGFQPSHYIRRAVRSLTGTLTPTSDIENTHRIIGGAHAPSEVYALARSSRFRFFSGDMFDRLGNYSAFEDLPMDTARLKRWHPLNQSLYMGYKTILPGLLMNHKGDRVAMASSVETRYPFLDDDVINFCAQVHPRWKLKGLIRDKHLLRTMAADILPKSIVRRPKAMFRAPFAEPFFGKPPAYVDQLLSEESLRKTGFFRPDEILAYRSTYQRTHVPGKRLFIEMGLTAALATQLWHHVYLGGGLCDLPTWSPPTTKQRIPTIASA
jgi:asparagine synthase (glutamine-hydrolysing)